MKNLFLAILFLPALATGQVSGSFSGAFDLPATTSLIFSHDFEDGTKNGFDVDPWPGDVTVSTANPKNGTYHLRAHYECVYSGSTCSVNRWLGESSTINHHHVFVQFQYSVHVNAGGSVEDLQRKVVWGDNDAAGSFDYAFILGNWWASPNDGKMHLSMTANVGPGCTAWQDWNLATLEYDTHYRIEVEWQLESGAGTDDARYKLWVDGDLKASGSGKCVRGTNIEPFDLVRFGVQSDGDTDIDEEHDFDDVKIAESYIGP